MPSSPGFRKKHDCSNYQSIVNSNERKHGKLPSRASHTTSQRPTSTLSDTLDFFLGDQRLLSQLPIARLSVKVHKTEHRTYRFFFFASPPAVVVDATDEALLARVFRLGRTTTELSDSPSSSMVKASVFFTSRAIVPFLPAFALGAGALPLPDAGAFFACVGFGFGDHSSMSEPSSASSSS